MLGWIQLEVPDDQFRKLLIVAAEKTQEAKAGNEDDRAFEGFEKRDGSEGFVGDGRHEPDNVGYVCTRGKKKAAQTWALL